MRRPRRPLLLIGPLVLTLAACGTARDGHTFRTFEEDGVVHAENTGGPKYEEDLFRLEKVLTLQEDPQNEESLLVRPSVFYEGPDGRFYVMDGGAHRVAVFDASGDFVTSYGRPGQGPGEFTWMERMTLIGDEICVFDSQQTRLTRLGLDGTILETLQPRVQGPVGVLQRLEDGRLFIRENRGSWGDTYLVHASTGYLMDEAGSDTLAVWTTRTHPTGQIRIDPNGMRGAYGMPFSTPAFLEYSAALGFLHVDGHVPEFEVYDDSGDLRMVVSTDLPQRPFDPMVADLYAQYVERRSELLAREGRGPYKPPIEWQWPENAPYWTWPYVDPGGHVWLLDAVQKDLRLPGEPYQTHVFAPSGEYLGTTPVPSYSNSIRSGRLCAVVPDLETGELIPTVCRLVPKPESFVYP